MAAELEVGVEGSWALSFKMDEVSHALYLAAEPLGLSGIPKLCFPSKNNYFWAARCALVAQNLPRFTKGGVVPRQLTTGACPCDVCSGVVCEVVSLPKFPRMKKNTLILLSCKCRCVT